MSQQERDVVEGEIVSEEPLTRDLSVRPDTGMRPIDLTEFRAWADSRAEALRILMDMGIAQTKAEDWSNQGGKPYPEQGACSAMINMVGIVISPPGRRRENFHDELGDYYIYFLESDVTVPKFGIGPIPIVGRASSRDQFFAWKRGEGNEKVLRPASEIDPGDILAKSYTNLRYRAVKAVVPAIANITFEDLAVLTAGKVAREKVRQIHYGNGGEEPAALGNCPTCGKGTLVERKRRDGTGSFWACNAGSYDSSTKKRTGCQHIQNDPPAPPATSPPPEEQATPQEAASEAGLGPSGRGPMLSALEQQVQRLVKGHPDSNRKEVLSMGLKAAGIEKGIKSPTELSDEELAALVAVLKEQE